MSLIQLGQNGTGVQLPHKELDYFAPKASLDRYRDFFLIATRLVIVKLVDL